MCSAVSYFSTRRGSIIGADRLSFRVRDGSGRFPVAITAVTLFPVFDAVEFLTLVGNVLVVAPWVCGLPAIMCFPVSVSTAVNTGSVFGGGVQCDCGCVVARRLG